MSRAAVGMVVEELLTYEYLRVQFALDPVETVADLFLRGFDLTREEIIFILSDRCWFVVPQERRQRPTTALRSFGPPDSDKQTFTFFERGASTTRPPLDALRSNPSRPAAALDVRSRPRRGKTIAGPMGR